MSVLICTGRKSEKISARNGSGESARGKVQCVANIDDCQFIRNHRTVTVLKWWIPRSIKVNGSWLDVNSANQCLANCNLHYKYIMNRNATRYFKKLPWSFLKLQNTECICWFSLIKKMPLLRWPNFWTSWQLDGIWSSEISSDPPSIRNEGPQ